MDPDSGLIDGKNCRGQEKVARLKQALGKPAVKKAYSDSLADLPILSMAEEGFIVKGDKILSLESYQKTSRLRRLFL
jgi:phosphoserine phosphatase